MSMFRGSLINFILNLFSFSAIAAGPAFQSGFFNLVDTNWWRKGSTLDLDFAGNKYYLNGSTYASFASLVTAIGGSFSRSSTASYFDSSGTMQFAAVDTARLTYEPSSLTAKGLLIEEGSTNLIIQSENFTGTDWNLSSGITSVTTNAVAAPDGTNTAEQLDWDGSIIAYFHKGNLASQAGQTITRSLFVKAGTSSRVYFEFADPTNCLGSNCVVRYDLSAKTATWTTAGTGQGIVRLIPIKNGWYRIEATFTHSASGVTNFSVHLGNYGLAPAGNLYVWGAQMEVKPFASSYIPTAATAVARSADQFSVPTGAWYDAAKGTFLATTYAQTNSTQAGYSRVIGLDANKSSLGFAANQSLVAGSWSGAGVSLASPNGNFTYPNTTVITPVKLAFAWDQGTTTRSVSVAGGKLSSDTYSGDYTTTSVYFGGSNYDPLNAPLSRVTFFPVKMNDAFLKGMTP